MTTGSCGRPATGRSSPTWPPAAADVAGAGHVLALAWTQLTGPDTTVEAGFGIGRAHDWPSFVAAAERYTAPQQNMAFADRDGHHRHDQPGPGPDPPQRRRQVAGAWLDRRL